MPMLNRIGLSWFSGTPRRRNGRLVDFRRSLERRAARQQQQARRRRTERLIRRYQTAASAREARARVARLQERIARRRAPKVTVEGHVFDLHLTAARVVRQFSRLTRYAKLPRQVMATRTLYWEFLSNKVYRLALFNRKAKTAATPLFPHIGKFDRSKVFISCVTHELKLDAATQQVVELLKDRGKKQFVANKQFTYTVDPTIKYLSEESANFAAQVEDMYFKYVITCKQDGLVIEEAEREVNQILTSHRVTIPEGVCARLDKAGMSGQSLPVAHYFRINKEKAVFFVTKEQVDFAAVLQHGMKAGLDQIMPATMFKRFRREDAPARLTLRFAVTGQTITERQTSHGPVPMALLHVTCMEAYTWGRRIAVPPGGFFHTQIGVLLHDENSYASRYLADAWEGNHPGSVALMNDLLTAAGIREDVHPRVEHLMGDNITAAMPEDLGHGKGLTTYTKDVNDVLFLFTDRKSHVYRTDDEVWISLGPINQHPVLNSDKESVHNADIAGAVNPATGRPALVDNLVYYLNRYYQALVHRDDAKLAELMHLSSGSAEQASFGEYAEDTGYVLGDTIQFFANNRVMNGPKQRLSVTDLPRPTAKILRRITQTILDVKELHIPYQPGLGASGEAAPDYSVLHSEDPAQCGHFFYENGVLQPHEFSLVVHDHLAGQNDPAMADLLSQLGILDADSRYLWEGIAAMYRRPSGWIGEFVPDMMGVVTEFYLRGLRSPFAFLSCAPVEITPEIHAWLAQRLTPSKLGYYDHPTRRSPQGAATLYSKFLRSDGKIFIPFNVLAMALMGWGDNDDIACFLGGYVAEHVIKQYHQYVENYPDLDINKPAEKPVTNRWALRSTRTAAEVLAEGDTAIRNAILDNFNDNTIGRLSNAKQLYHCLMFNNKRPATLIPAAFRRTDEVIDALMTGKGEVHAATVKLLLKQFRAEIDRTREVPRWYYNRQGADRQKQLTPIDTPIDLQIAEMQAELDEFTAEITSRFIEVHYKDMVRINALRDYQTPYADQAAELRQAFKELVQEEIDLALEAYAEVIKLARDEHKEGVINDIKRSARTKASLKADRTLYQSIPSDVLGEIAIALYGQIHDDHYKWYAQIEEKEGKAIERCTLISDGQLWQPTMGAAFLQAWKRLHFGLPSTAPAPAPQRGRKAKTLAPKENLGFVTVVNGTSSKSKEAREQFLALAENKAKVSYRLLYQNNPSDMEKLHALIPAWKAQNKQANAVAIFIKKELRGWVSSETLNGMFERAQGRKVLKGYVLPLVEKGKTAQNALRGVVEF